MVKKEKQVYKRKELHILMNDEVYHYEFHTTDFKNGILNIIRRKTGKYDQQKWRRIE